MKPIPLFAQKPIDSPKTDSGLVIAILLFLGLGLITLYAASASYANRIFDNDLYFVQRQAISIGIGLVLMLAAAWVNMDMLRKILPLIVIGSFILCLLTFVPGIGLERNGASRWIRLPFLSTFQPSEAAKLAVVLFLANLFAKKYNQLDNPMISVNPAATGLFLFVIVVFLQGDFSTAVFILLLGLIIFFAAGVKIYWFLIFSLFAAPVAVLFIFTEKYRVNRLIAFLKPNEYIDSMNYQIAASRKAISAGGFWGQGIGGIERVNAIPEVQADFIFAGWAEAMGFIGVLIYMLLLLVFTWKSFSIALRCTDRFRSLTAFGCTLIIFIQSLTNIAVVCGALPSTGIPLPFFSSGGSSILISLCICGLLINVARYKNSESSELLYE